MSIDCRHGSFAVASTPDPDTECPECRMARIEALLERIALAVEGDPEGRIQAVRKRYARLISQSQETARRARAIARGG